MQTFENKGAEVHINGSAKYANGTELTKMKEVMFEKNPSEPMVHLIFATHFHFFFFPTMCINVAWFPPHLSLNIISPLQGVTLKMNDKQRCTVARILHGGFIHRQGSTVNQNWPDSGVWLKPLLRGLSWHFDIWLCFPQAVMLLIHFISSLFFSRIPARRGWDNRNQWEKCDEPNSRSAAKDFGELTLN